MTGSDRKVGRENLRNRVALLVLGAGGLGRHGSKAARQQGGEVAGSRRQAAGAGPNAFPFSACRSMGMKLFRGTSSHIRASGWIGRQFEQICEYYGAICHPYLDTHCDRLYNIWA